MAERKPAGAEIRRLLEDQQREKNWKRWGPYLSERQWGTVREDYSADGDAWSFFPFEHARSRAYRWGEDGLLGITDRECRLCFALALWNERDPILKERLFGLSNPQGNHGEDVKEHYFYLRSTPTHSYMKVLYKYPQAAFPYEELVRENARRSRDDAEYELTDTGVFNESRYFDVFAEYAKDSPDDILIRIEVVNRGPDTARLHVLPTLWFRNTWVWGCRHEGCWIKPRIDAAGPNMLRTSHVSLGKFRFTFGPGPDGESPQVLWTENETNLERIFGEENFTPYVRDAFHDCIVEGRSDAVNPDAHGTKAAPHYIFTLQSGESGEIRMRLSAEAEASGGPLGSAFQATFRKRMREAETFERHLISRDLPDDVQETMRQGYAGLLWSKQFYHYIVADWLEGDPNMPPPPEERYQGRNADWPDLFNRDIISMPDKWEYPWYAAWDLAFHMVPFARIDPHFAKQQLSLFLREWYMHANGQLPAYEWDLSDVNPPVHAWACWRVYKIAAPRGQRDRAFLAGAFQKLLMNFTWWVNRKDAEGRNVFSGGFLGMDNIGVFDRSAELPEGGRLDQADGTAWMAFYCATMLAIAIELALEDPIYEDVASKFFEHFVSIADAMNSLGGDGLWNEQDGFYYDHLLLNGEEIPLRTRSLVGLLPLIAVNVLDDATIERLPGFRKRMLWFLENRKDLARNISYMELEHEGGDKLAHRLLAIPSRERLLRVLGYMLDEAEFLSPYGIRSLSKIHGEQPFVFQACGEDYRVDYVPGESNTGLFGGNSNWRGPIWFPINYLLIEALERYHHFYGDTLQVDFPTGSGRKMNLRQVANELACRLTRLFLPDDKGRRPCHGDETLFAEDPHWRDLTLFHEYFHAETGEGLGASHQTGWTALVLRFLEDLCR